MFVFMLQALLETQDSDEDESEYFGVIGDKTILKVPEGFLPVRYMNYQNNTGGDEDFGIFGSGLGHSIPHDKLKKSDCFTDLDDWEVGSIYVLRPIKELKEAGVVMMAGEGIKWDPVNVKFISIPKPTDHPEKSFSWNSQTQEWGPICSECGSQKFDWATRNSFTDDDCCSDNDRKVFKSLFCDFSNDGLFCRCDCGPRRGSCLCNPANHANHDISDDDLDD
jgi:hypothetical protein